MPTNNLSFSLIICTFERAVSLERLLISVGKQELYPDEVLIVDGSLSNETWKLCSENKYRNLRYFKVSDADRGLTRQRNYGINKSAEVDIICFLDDDIVLKAGYFSELLSGYQKRPEALAVGGWIEDATSWKRVDDNYQLSSGEFLYDGYVRKLGQRHEFRKRLGLSPDKPPGFMPEFSHGFSTGFLPPSGKIYEVEYFMGGVSSYRREIFKKAQFSSYFEGYGLYEDMDFCLQISKLGKLYVQTGARVLHLHEESGRPDYFKYGKMVIENGYRVWRLRYPAPSGKAKMKWYTISLLLALIRLVNYLKGDKNGLDDFGGRIRALAKKVLS